MSKTYKTGLVITADASGAVKAIGLTEDGLKKVNSAYDKHGKRVKKNNGLTKAFSETLGSAAHKALAWGGAIGGASLGLAGFATQLDRVDKIGKMSDRIGADARALSEYEHVADLTGTTLDALSVSWQRQSRRIADAARGQGEAVYALNQLGLSAAKLRDLAPEEQFEVLADALMGVANEGDRLSYAVKIWDTEGAAMLQTIQGGSEGLREMRAHARDLGKSLSAERVDSVERFNDSLSDLGAVISGNLMQGFSGAAGDLADFNSSLVSVLSQAGVVEGALSSLTTVVVAGAGAWGLYSAAAAAATLRSGLLTKSLYGTSVAATAAAGGLGKLQVALGVLFAAFAGWEFGTYLSENFVEVRVAGLVFVATMLKAWEQLKFGFDAAVVSIQYAWDSYLSHVKTTYGEWLATAANAISGIPGLKGISQSLSDFSNELLAAAGNVVPLEKQMQRLTAARDKELDKIDENIIGLISYQLEQKKTEKVVSESQKKLAGKKVSLSDFAGTNGIKSAKTELDKLIESVDKFGGAWSRSGNAMIDSFGNMADVLDDYVSRMSEVSSLQAGLTLEKEKAIAAGKETKEIDESLAKLNRESYKSQLSAVGSLAGMTSKMFKENSKERKALHALEMGFMAAEMVLAAEKAVLNAVSSVAQAGNTAPPASFASVAAMIAVMAGVLGAAGIAFNGGGAGSYTPPSVSGGTVLGSDEKSQSISNASEFFEDIQIDQLAELRGIREAINNLSTGIEKLAISFVSNLDFEGGGYSGELGTIKTSADSLLGKMGSKIDDLFGGLGIASSIIGSFSSTKKKLIDSGIHFISQTLGDVLDSGELAAELYSVVKTTKKKFWGLSKKERYSTHYDDIDVAINEQMGRIFGYISDSVIQSAELLGFDSVEVQRLQSGAQFDLVGALLGGLLDPSEIPNIVRNWSEGAVETVEVSLQEALADYQIDIGNISFKDKSGEEIQEELEALFSQQSDLIAEYLVPSISDFQKIGEGAFETLQRVAVEQITFNDHLERTGMGLTDLSSVMQIEVAQAIFDLMGGFEEFSEASNAYFDAFFTEGEKFDRLSASIQDVFSGLDVVLPETRMGFRGLVEGLDLANEEGRSLYAELLRLSPVMAEYYSQLEDQGRVTNDLATNTGSLGDAYRVASAEAKAAFDKITSAATSARSSIASRIGNIRGANVTSISSLRANLGQGSALDQITTIQSLSDAIAERYESERQALQDAHSQQQDMARAAHDARVSEYEQLIGLSKQLREYSESLLLSDLSPLTKKERLDEAQRQYNSLLLRTQAGDADAAGQLSSVADSYLGAARDYYTTPSDEYASIFQSVRSGIGLAAENAAQVSNPGEFVSQGFDNSRFAAQLTQLGEQSVEELQNLDEMLVELQEQAAADYELAMAQVEQTYREGTADVVAAVQEQTQVLSERLDQVSDSVDQNNAVVQQQVAEQQTATNVLRAEFSQLNSAVETQSFAIANLDFISRAQIP